jgi:hypothetical protein
LSFLIDKKNLENKLSFWLPLRANVILMNSLVHQKLEEMNFGGQVFDRESLERHLAGNKNATKIELRRVTNATKDV